jgi:2-succinyl-5-enolpyruvyl-6-hydroxy-3-cyclohexene-1-carboxylate synthase
MGAQLGTGSSSGSLSAAARLQRCMTPSEMLAVGASLTVHDLPVVEQLLQRLAKRLSTR